MSSAENTPLRRSRRSVRTPYRFMVDGYENVDSTTKDSTAKARQRRSVLGQVSNGSIRLNDIDDVDNIAIDDLQKSNQEEENFGVGNGVKSISRQLFNNTSADSSTSLYGLDRNNVSRKVCGSGVGNKGSTTRQRKRDEDGNGSSKPSYRYRKNPGALVLYIRHVIKSTCAWYVYLNLKTLYFFSLAKTRYNKMVKNFSKQSEKRQSYRSGQSKNLAPVVLFFGTIIMAYLLLFPDMPTMVIENNVSPGYSAAAALNETLGQVDSKNVLRMLSNISDLELTMRKLKHDIAILEEDLKNRQVKYEDSIITSVTDIYKKDKERMQKQIQRLTSQLQNDEQLNEKNGPKIEKVEQEISDLKLSIETIQENEKKIAKRSNYNNNNNNNTNSDADIDSMIENKLKQYDADKVGMPDFALETAGASIIPEITTPSYGQVWLLNVMGISLTNAPETAIQSNIDVGNCWAVPFPKFGPLTRPASLGIQLSEPIVITHFSIDHIPHSIARSPSAPKTFRVWGFEKVMYSQVIGAHYFGEYAYKFNAKSDAVQTFSVDYPSTAPFEYVKIELMSNHGHPEYTCLYRVRIHGERDKSVRLRTEKDEEASMKMSDHNGNFFSF